MDSVAFLQQQIDEISLQITQLMDKRYELFIELGKELDKAKLQKYNLHHTV